MWKLSYFSALHYRHSLSSPTDGRSSSSTTTSPSLPFLINDIYPNWCHIGRSLLWSPLVSSVCFSPFYLQLLFRLRAILAFPIYESVASYPGWCWWTVVIVLCSCPALNRTLLTFCQSHYVFWFDHCRSFGGQSNYLMSIWLCKLWPSRSMKRQL